MILRQPEGRLSDKTRPTTIETNVNRYAEGSVLIKMGHTHVLCTATVEETVPKWLQGKGQGWITAEYSMLPRATQTRTKRDREKTSGRTQEIQRLIGRALRASVHLNALGERTIIMDCDVLQADGGTRTASITGACVALALALKKLCLEQKLPDSNWPGTVWADTVSAISVGLKDGQVLVDLDYNEDSSCDVDMNFVVTGSGQLVEVQGTAEGKSFAKSELDQMLVAAMGAAEALQKLQLKAIQ